MIREMESAIDRRETGCDLMGISPGPWKYTGKFCNDHGGQFYEIVDANGDIIIGENGGPYSEEDAHIIEKAREMVELLDDIRLHGYTEETHGRVCAILVALKWRQK